MPGDLMIGLPCGFDVSDIPVGALSDVYADRVAKVRSASAGAGGREVSLMMALFGAILPRFVILVGWSNDQAGWAASFSSPVWLLGGFLFFPWTTLIYAFVQPNGLSLLNIIFLVAAFAIDLGTWGIGFFASREQVSNYRGT